MPLENPVHFPKELPGGLVNRAVELVLGRKAGVKLTRNDWEGLWCVAGYAADQMFAAPVPMHLNAPDTTSEAEFLKEFQDQFNGAARAPDKASAFNWRRLLDLVRLVLDSGVLDR